MSQSSELPFSETDLALKPFTWYGVGGTADIVLTPNNRDEAAEAYEWMVKQNRPVIILGGGTNVLVSDSGFHGIVLLTRQINSITETSTNHYTIESGLILDRMVQHIMIARNYEGVGALAGIPGTVGGAVFMNAGTANGSICEMIDWVDIMSAEGIRQEKIENGMYQYRHQSFCKSDEVIVAAGFHFEQSQEDQKAIYDHYIERRRLKQPSGRCCGSVFKNPPGDHAGRLIEACGLKGQRKGGAIISPMHGNFIMNDAGATFDDIIYLMRLCRDHVHERFNITLEPEVKIIGKTGLLNL